MKVFEEIYSLDDFDFWGPAVQTVNLMSDKVKKTVFEAIENVYPDGIDNVQLNDILAYDDDWLKEVVGFDFTEYKSKEDMKEKQTEYIVKTLKCSFSDYDEDVMNAFAEGIVDAEEYDDYVDKGICQAFIDDYGEDHANNILDDEISGYDDQKSDFIDTYWDYYKTDEENVKAFRDYLEENEEYQRDLKESWDEIDEDEKRDKK